MPRFEDYRSDSEVPDIIENLLKKFPRVFEGFDVGEIGFIVTQKKKIRGKHPIKVRTLSYPNWVFAGKTYIFETFETRWQELSKKKKNLAVFHAMCAIPVGGFDPASKAYGKLVKPDFDLYRYELAASGGVADWYEDERARDPMEIATDAVTPPAKDGDDEDPIPSPAPKKAPVTVGDIESAGEDEVEAVAS